MIRVRLHQRFVRFTLDVDFESTGPVVGVFGRSGAGKTTLLHALAGIVKTAEATVRIDEDILCQRPGEIWVPPESRRLALVTQDPLLFPHLTTRGNLTYSPRGRSALQEAYGRRVVDVLRLAPLLGRSPQTLSGGEQQRVALGRALLSEPRWLLLDEPTAALDAELSREVLALLLEAKRSLGVRMILVTHRAPELLALADDCVVLDAGRVVAQGSPLEVIAKPRGVGVANLVGVDNLLRLAVERHDEVGGVSWLALGAGPSLGAGQSLATPLIEALAGDRVDIGLYAEDIILSRARPGATSARNCLTGTITALDPVGHEVLVSLEVGSVALRCRVTPGAVRELGLAMGQSAFALIKTTACHHLSAYRTLLPDG